MSRASALYRLQKVDSELDQRQSRLSEIADRLASSSAVQKAQAEFAAAQAAAAAARRRAKALDDENKSLTAQIKEIEERLYGGRVRNPRELQDLQAEAESLKRRRESLDEDQLAALDEAESAEEKEASAREALAAAEAARASEAGDLLREEEAIEALIAKLEGEREVAVASVQADDLAAYDSLRKRKRGTAVALLTDGACSACGVAPSSSRIQAARHAGAGELVRCGNCERILYAEQGESYSETGSREDETITRW